MSADKGMTLAIVLLIAGLIVGGGIGYFAAPTTTLSNADDNMKVIIIPDDVRHINGDTIITGTAKIFLYENNSVFMTGAEYTLTATLTGLR